MIIVWISIGGIAMSIRTKLLIALIASLVLIGAVGGFALVQLSAISNQAAKLGDRVIPALTTVEQISRTLADYRILQSAYIAAVSEQDQLSVQVRLRAAEQRMISLLEAYSQFVDENDREPLARLQTGWPVFVSKTWDQLIPTGQSRIYARSFAVYRELEIDYTQLTAASADLVAASREDTSVVLRESSAILNRAWIVIIAATLIAAGVMFSGWAAIAIPIRRAIKRLMLATEAIGRGEFDHVVDIQGRDELGALANALRRMQLALGQAQRSVMEQQSTLALRAGELEQTLAELRTSNTSRDQLTEAIRALSSPVLPIMRGVIVLPLIGLIDDQRAAILTETMLHAIERQHAHTLIIDITGVPLVDTHVAGALIQAAGAARLLGAETVLVGLRPELAQTIVGLGIDLSHLVSRSDLESGIRYASSRVR